MITNEIPFLQTSASISTIAGAAIGGITVLLAVVYALTKRRKSKEQAAPEMEIPEERAPIAPAEEAPRVPEQKAPVIPEPVTEQFCIKCGNKLVLGSRFCDSCGAKQP